MFKYHPAAQPSIAPLNDNCLFILDYHEATTEMNCPHLIFVSVPQQKL